MLFGVLTRLGGQLHQIVIEIYCHIRCKKKDNVRLVDPEEFI